MADSRGRRVMCGAVVAALAMVLAQPVALGQATAGEPDSAGKRAGKSPAADTPTEATKPGDEDVTAAEWDAAPLPTEASGVERPADDEGSPALWIPRVIFFVPKWVFWAAAQPVRGAAYLYERYQVRDRFDQIFFNDDGTIGAYPVALFETGFGLNVGGRIVHRDLFGQDERARLRVSYGGEFRQRYSAKFTSGNRFGDRVQLQLEADFEVRPKDKFFGIGNADETDTYPTTPVDAYSSDLAVSTRFSQNVTRGVLGAEMHLGGDLHAKLSGAVMLRSFGESDETDEVGYVGDSYLASSLPTFEDGLSNFYSEIELRYDSRRRTSDYLTEALPATGWLLSGWVGHATGFSGDPSRYVRYGVDVQRYINLYGGSRILALRALVDGVGGDLTEVPFVELPSLGGSQYLRGYHLGRFRDRAATLGQVEYQYDVITDASMFVFADAGRVWRRLRDFELEGFHFGFGGGIQVHSRKNFYARFQVSYADDGSLFFSLSFDPARDTPARAGSY